MSKTCKICKEKFEPKYSSVQCVCSPKCSYEYAKRQREKKEAKKKKEWNQKAREWKQNDPKNKSNPRNILSKEIQKLARLIDVSFNLKCCCCNKPIEGSGHGAHYHNKQGNENIKYNLHNIHRSRAHCNEHNSEHKKGYYIELEKRYGTEYRDYIEHDLRLQYKEMHFTIDEINNALKTTRKLIREFDTFQFNDPVSARNQLNAVIGLYKGGVTN